MKSEKELSLKEVLLILRRRKWIIAGVTLFFLALGIMYCMVCARRYEAIGTVQLQKESADAMGLENILGGSSDVSSNPIGASIELQTQANILQSDTLALKTIEKLHLEGTDEFRRPSSFFSWFSLANQEKGKTLEDSAEQRRHVLLVFHKNLHVKPVNGTRLIEIRYLNPNPKLAAVVVNTLIQSLVDYTFQTRFDAANQTSKWLSDQLGDLRKNSEDLQAKVANLERQAGVYGLDIDNSNGSTAKVGGGYSEVLDRLQQATMALSTAEQNRIMKEAIMRAARAGDAEMLSGLAGNSLGGGSQGLNNALGLIQSLRQQEAIARASLEQAEAKYGSAYSRVAELRGQLSAIQSSIQDEVKRIRARAESDYQVSVHVEEGARQQYQSSKDRADKLNDKAIEFTIVRQDAEQSRSVYENLLRRLKEAGVLEGLRSSNITVVDPGRDPARPAKPNQKLAILFSFAGGIFIGILTAIFIELFDNKVNGIVDLDEVIGGELLGALPVIPADLQNVTNILLECPQSSYAESIRTIRTALLLFRSEKPPQTILITSSVQGEGKSTFTINLATALAQRDKRVLVVDVDLRRRTLSHRMKVNSTEDGLSSLLSGMVQETQPHLIFQNLEFIQAGPLAPNPSELIDSQKMRDCLEQWRAHYDFVILDGVPILPVTDSIPLSAMVDVSLLLVRTGVAEKNQVKHSCKTLSRGGKHLVGIVVNDLREDSRSYYGSYSYYSRYEGGK